MRKIGEARFYGSLPASRAAESPKGHKPLSSNVKFGEQEEAGVKRNGWISLIMMVAVLTALAASVTALPPVSAGKTMASGSAPRQATVWPTKWLVYFSGDSQWSKSVAGAVQLENIHTQGTARVECDSTGLNCTAHVSQSGTYLYTSSSPQCGSYAITRKWITNPGQWSVYDDSNYWTMFAYHRANGTDGMTLPFSISRPYDVSLHSSDFGPDCVPSDSTDFGGYQDPWTPLVKYDPGPHELTFTVPSMTFYVDRTWLDNSFQPPATRHYSIRAFPQYGCQGSGPIVDEAGVPLHIQLDSDFPEIRPDGAAILTAHVTCDGVPVKNAQVNFETLAVPNTGYHAHGDTLTPRPNGCLDGVNRQDGFVPVMTDDQGVARVTFQPGTLEACGTPRGIAGRYRITARSDRYPEIYNQKSVDVLRRDLVSVSHMANVQMCAPNPYHYDYRSDGGNGATASALSGIATNLIAAQAAENQVRVAQHLPPWPLQFIPIGPMTLLGGGLFDANGDWSTPYSAHFNGSSIDFVPACWPVGADQSEWLKSTLMRVGSSHGIWSLNESGGWLPALHLEVFAAQQYMLTPDVPTSDVAVVALLSGPTERLVAAPGQTVTYAMGVDNMTGTADAGNVTLTTTLPAGLNFINANPAPTRILGNDIVWDVGTMLSGTLPQLVHVVAQVGAGVTPGTVLTVTAQVTTSDADANPANNQSDAGGLLIRLLGPDLAIRSGLAETDMTVDRPVTFTLDAINLGTAIAPDAALTLTLPASVTLRSANPVTTSSSAGVVVWLLGDITPSDFKTITASVEFDGALMNQVALDAITPVRQLTYTVKVGSAADDIAPDDNTRQIVKPVELAGPDLAAWLNVEGLGTSGTIKTGQDLTYTINYGNWGNQVAHTTTLTLSLGSGLSVISVQPAPTRTTTSTVFSGMALGWDWGNLDVNDSGAAQVHVHVDSMSAEGSLVIAAIQSAGLDIRPMNNVDMDSRLPVMNHIYLPIVLR
jgi:uncharacterized repeat protein (TIGR01451 family)